MNNIYLNDPLLYNHQRESESLLNYYKEKLKEEPPITQMRDWLSDLDNEMKHLDGNVVDRLNNNDEYMSLHSSLQSMIQDELLSVVKNRLNNYPSVIDNVKKQMDIIKKISSEEKEEQRRSMNELNDYMKNYSHMTFDEYKKLKNNTSQS